MFKKDKDLVLGLIIFAIILSFVVGIVYNDSTAVLKRVKQYLAVETDEGAKVAILNEKTNKDWVIKSIKKGKLSNQSMQMYLDAGVIGANDVYKVLKSTRNKSVIDNVTIGDITYRVYVPKANEVKLVNIKKDLQIGKTANAYGFTQTESKFLGKQSKNITTYIGDQEIAAIAYQVLVENNTFRTNSDEQKLEDYVTATYPKIEETGRTVAFAKKYVNEIATDSRLSTIIVSIPTGLIFAVPTAALLLGLFFMRGGFKKEIM